MNTSTLPFSVFRRPRTEWNDAVLALPVFDTHTHLNRPGVPIAARSVWDIVEYFWFRQELESVGYPLKTKELPEAERREHFARAFALARNTVWARVIQGTFQELYGVTLSDARSIAAADEAVRATSADPAWPRAVADRLHVTRIFTNIEAESDYPELPGVGGAVPVWTEHRAWSQRILDDEEPREVAAEAVEALRRDVAGIAARGHRGMRIATGAFNGKPQAVIEAAIASEGRLLPRTPSPLDVEVFLAHNLLRALGEHNLFAQFFLGIVSLPGCGTVMAVDDPRTITNLYPLFERYSCDFELVAGAPGLNMDVVQAARIYPNVYAGGLWWYNFRPGTYREAMRARLEGVPAGKCALLASDGRCIEWCYAKTMLVKHLLADFMQDQIRQGWINEADAFWVAREWLHDAAERRYV